MPVYLGDVPLDSAAVGATAASAIYLGSTKIWPAVTFPYVIENSNVTDADVPVGATGCWVTLHGPGADGADGPQSSYSSSARTVQGGGGGGGGAAIPRFFIPASALGPTWSLTLGTPARSASDSRFVSGTITLTAGGGKGGDGGTATATGITGVTTIDGGNAASNAIDNADSTGAGAGGGKGGNSQKSSNASPTNFSGIAGGSATVIPATGVAPNGGNGAKARSSGSQTSGTMYGGGGGGGGGAYPGGGPATTSTVSSVGGDGGAGYVKVEWVTNHYWSAPDIGSWSFTPPAWAKAGDLCDVILIGGGVAGGEGSNSATGPGGNAASYVTQTITLGVQLAPNGTLSGTVGAGGTPNGSAGGATTCTQLGLSAAGATGTSAGQAGKTPTPVTVGGTTYADFGAGGDGGPSKGIFGLGNGTGAPGQRGGVLICVRGAS